VHVHSRRRWLAGVAVMTAGEKIEQALTNGLIPPSGPCATGDDDQPPVWNHLMHWSTGAFLGALWSVTGVRGPLANVCTPDAPGLRPDSRECDRSCSATEVVDGSGAGD